MRITEDCRSVSTSECHFCDRCARFVPKHLILQVKCPILCDITTCSPIRINRRFGARWLSLPSAFMLVSCFVYSSTLKMRVTCSSETSVDFHRTTRLYIRKHITLRNHRLRTSNPTYSVHVFTKGENLMSCVNTAKAVTWIHMQTLRSSVNAKLSVLN
jgi:hypothetical protein